MTGYAPAKEAPGVSPGQLSVVELEDRLTNYLHLEGLQELGVTQSVEAATDEYARAKRDAVRKTGIAGAVQGFMFKVGLSNPDKAASAQRKALEAVRQQLVGVERAYENSLDTATGAYEQMLQRREAAFDGRKMAKQLISQYRVQLEALSEFYTAKQKGDQTDGEIIAELDASDKYGSVNLDELSGKSLPELRTMAYGIKKGLRARTKDGVRIGQRIKTVSKEIEGIETVKIVLDNKIDGIDRRIAIVEEGLANVGPSIDIGKLLVDDAYVTQLAEGVVERASKMAGDLTKAQRRLLETAGNAQESRLQDIVDRNRTGDWEKLREQAVNQRRELDAMYQDQEVEINDLEEALAGSPIF